MVKVCYPASLETLGFVTLYKDFLGDFEKQRVQRSHEQMRRRLTVSSKAGIAGNQPLKLLVPGAV